MTSVLPGCRYVTHGFTYDDYLTELGVVRPPQFVSLHSFDQRLPWCTCCAVTACMRQQAVLAPALQSGICLCVAHARLLLLGSMRVQQLPHLVVLRF